MKPGPEQPLPIEKELSGQTTIPQSEKPLHFSPDDPHAQTLNTMAQVRAFLFRNRRRDEEKVFERLNKTVFDKIQEGTDHATVLVNLRPWLNEAAQQVFPEDPDKQTKTIRLIEIMLEELVNASPLDFLAEAGEALSAAQRPGCSSLVAWGKYLQNPENLDTHTKALLTMKGFGASTEGSARHHKAWRTSKAQLQEVARVLNPETKTTTTACVISRALQRIILKESRLESEKWQDLSALATPLSIKVDETIEETLGDERWREGAKRESRLQTTVLEFKPESQKNGKPYFFLVEDTILPKPGDKKPREDGVYNYFAPTSGFKFYLVRIPPAE